MYDLRGHINMVNGNSFNAYYDARGYTSWICYVGQEGGGGDSVSVEINNNGKLC